MSTGGPPNYNPSLSGDSNPENTHPSQLKAHAKYMKGAVSEKLGNLTSNEHLSMSGSAEKRESIDEMRAAKAQADRTMDFGAEGGERLKAEGKAEGALGSAVGCGGMVERGREKVEMGEKKTQ